MEAMRAATPESAAHAQWPRPARDRGVTHTAVLRRRRMRAASPAANERALTRSQGGEMSSGTGHAKSSNHEVRGLLRGRLHK